MSAESACRAALLAAPAVVALVDQRIAIDRMEEGAAFPFIVLSRTASSMEYVLDGNLMGSECSMEIQCWADSHLAAAAVADAALQCINATLPNQVSGRSNAHDPDTDRSLVSLTVQWWEI